MKAKIVFGFSGQIYMLALLFVLSILSGCKGNDAPEIPSKEYPADVVYDWMKMQQRLLTGTPGLLPHIAGRTYAYLGLTLYESIVPGMEAYQSIAPQLSGDLTLPGIETDKDYFWPASLNAASASILRYLLPHTTDGLLDEIDSLESAYREQFQAKADAEALQRSADFGRSV